MEHGSGKGEMSPYAGFMPVNVRGYMQACVMSREVIRVFVDRIYSRNAKWF
jgi:hypothetical protein